MKIEEMIKELIKQAQEAEAMKANPELMKELATHTYNELNK